MQWAFTFAFAFNQVVLLKFVFQRRNRYMLYTILSARITVETRVMSVLLIDFQMQQISKECHNFNAMQRASEIFAPVIKSAVQTCLIKTKSRINSRKLCECEWHINSHSSEGNYLTCLLSSFHLTVASYDDTKCFYEFKFAATDKCFCMLNCCTSHHDHKNGKHELNSTGVCTAILRSIRVTLMCLCIFGTVHGYLSIG